MLLRDYHSEFSTCVPHTTRPPMPDEMDGEAYHFITEDALFAGVEQGAYVEVVPFEGHWYAFSLAALQTAMRSAPPGGCILDIADPNTLLALQASGIVPVTILLEAADAQAVRATCDSVSAAKASDMLTLATLIKHDFAAELSETVFNSGNLAQLAHQTCAVLVEAQAKAYWAPKVPPQVPPLRVAGLRSLQAAVQQQQHDASTEAEDVFEAQQQVSGEQQDGAQTQTETKTQVAASVPAVAAVFVPDPSAMVPRALTDEDMWCTEVIKLKRGYGGLGFSFAGGR